ncbi:unnamed protein product [Rotaria sp. Silwood1]|nr:unnamed protein product [Rotaria sp. Silwood1]
MHARIYTFSRQRHENINSINDEYVNEEQETIDKLCEGTKQSSKLPYESLLLLHLLPLLLVNIDLPNNLINKMVLGFPVSM